MCTGAGRPALTNDATTSGLIRVGGDTRRDWTRKPSTSIAPLAIPTGSLAPSALTRPRSCASMLEICPTTAIDMPACYPLARMRTASFPPAAPRAGCRLSHVCTRTRARQAFPRTRALPPAAIRTAKRMPTAPSSRRLSPLPRRAALLPQTASGTARRADPQRSPPANTRYARHRRARHRRARRRRARQSPHASRTRGRRREQSGMRRRPRASGRPRQCVRPDSR